MRSTSSPIRPGFSSAAPICLSNFTKSVGFSFLMATSSRSIRFRMSSAVHGSSAILSKHRQAPRTCSPGCSSSDLPVLPGDLLGHRPVIVRLRIAHNHQHLLKLLHEEVADVLKEDQSQNQMLVFRGIHLIKMFVR